MPAVVPERNLSVAECGEPSLAEAEPPIGIVIDVVHDAGDWGSLDVASDAVMAAAGALAAELAIGGSEACVALSSDAEVARLNATYRGKQTATNVLSFPAARAFDPAVGLRSLGDLVLAAETVEREARELGLPHEHHLQHLVVHGLLHLLGYDHEKDDEAEEMEALEVRILARLGIDNPYAAAGEPLTSRRQKPEPPKS
jgi:probable rRNA maturation factor